ncbi:beta-ketoacyl synthase N-terminal-like domain-containing protein [Catellatospora sp. KI3]|uniref:beta-ketoacyl synthase N-terminal-like domain-containing protein n=1 Tax=Catellatospora sp. KI3 TaxID=3041620 RepID=UPI002482FE77|nr:beta-ketoacyl synthase N-terminal-like domain-containing protein [Catellatospora sp. KI3]MDI1463941.1 beta-ketoacyl synthase N-terminal-like domain-containing protein [Catellatospora sp. KI3]
MADLPGRGDRQPVVLTGLSVLSAYGRGADALLAGLAAGRPAFAPVTRFDVANRRVGVGALLPGAPVLFDELLNTVDEACAGAGLDPAARATAPLLLAVHGDPTGSRVSSPDVTGHRTGAFTAALADKAGLAPGARTYTSACVAASSAVADAAALVANGMAERVVAAAGYLVDPDQFALFDAGRALAADGAVRPFSAGRKGLLLGDGVAAVVVESAEAAARRGASVLARLVGWGRAGDGYHVVQPRPDGAGLARAIGAALDRAGLSPADIGYVNAHGSGSAQSDVAEAAALALALGEHAATVPVSSTKSLHGQALEASPLLELVATVLSLRHGALPVNAGYLGADPDCPLNVITEGPLERSPSYALSLNAAFGGANTALLVGAV